MNTNITEYDGDVIKCEKCGGIHPPSPMDQWCKKQLPPKDNETTDELFDRLWKMYSCEIAQNKYGVPFHGFKQSLTEARKGMFRELPNKTKIANEFYHRQIKTTVTGNERAYVTAESIVKMLSNYEDEILRLNGFGESKEMFTEARVCKWEHADSLGKYHTSCQMYGAKTFADLWNYCPHCGGKIELTERKGR